MGWVKGDTIGVPRSSMQGVDRWVAYLNRRIEKIEGASLQGLIKAAVLVHEETLTGEVTTPVDLGNLRHSWFVVTSKGKIQSGGGKSHTPEGAAPGFTGPKAAEYAGAHTAMIKEMQGKADGMSREKKGAFLIMGYSVNYAMWVHEIVERHHAKPTGAKWFQKALFKHKGNILRIIKENVLKSMK